MIISLSALRDHSRHRGRKDSEGPTVQTAAWQEEVLITGVGCVLRSMHVVWRIIGEPYTLSPDLHL